MAKPVLIVGRGPSSRTFDWSSVDCHILAVSSGIFAVPRAVKVDHFVTLDEPKCFMAQLMNHCPNAWGNDPSVSAWPFWNDDSIVKHIVEGRKRTVTFVPIPFREIIAAISQWCDLFPDKLKQADGSSLSESDIKDAFYTAFGESGIGQFGFQPGWGDYRNVRGWQVKPYVHPRWTGDGPLSSFKCGSGKSFLFNSLLAAVQVAHRLGFDTLKFIGVDLLADAGYGDSLVVAMRRWHAHAERRGYRWLNLSPVSRLREFMETPMADKHDVTVDSQVDQAAFLDGLVKQRFGARRVKVVPIMQDGMMGVDIMPADEPEHAEAVA